MLHDIIKKGATDRSVTLRIIDSTDGTPETGVVWNTAGIDLWYRRQGGLRVAITEATLAALDSAHSDGGFLHISDGYYRLDLPDAAFATGANYVDFGGTVTGMVVIGGRVRLVDFDLEDTVRLGLTALPNAAADAAGGLPISDAGGLDMDSIKAKTDNLPATPADEATLTTIKQKAAGAFNRETDSLEAIRDRGDTAWITAPAITDILNITPLIPKAIDLADTVTVRLALALTNALDDLPTAAEITPGTVTIERKAIAATVWTTVVNAAACSEVAGQIYYDEVFDYATGYREGDSIRITFKSAKITVAANDYEIVGADGWVFQTYIREGKKANFDLS